MEPLPYPRRMRELALHARRHAGTPYLSALLAELSTGGRYERRTALHLAMAARELPFIADTLSGPDMPLRRAALRAVRTLPVPDDAVAAVLDDAPADLRRAFYRMLRHSDRSTLADRLLPQVRERWGEREAAALLPACGRETAARELPTLAYAVTAWRAVGTKHPVAFLDLMEDQLGDLHSSWSWWRRHRRGLDAAARLEPERALAAAERFRLGELARWWRPATVTALASVDPDRTLLLLKRTRRFYGDRNALSAFTRHLPACSNDTVAEVLGADPGMLREHLWPLAPGRRKDIIDGLRKESPGPFAGLGMRPLLDLLPSGAAAVEARGMLDWHASVWHSSRARLDDPNIHLELSAHLPYEEAAEILTEAAFGGDPRRRGQARALLVKATARTGDGEALRELTGTLVDRSRNEQDPLRAALVTALREAPPALLDDSFVPALERLAATVVEARDTSPTTRRELFRLAGRLLWHHPAGAVGDWAVGTLVSLLDRYGAQVFQPFAPARRGGELLRVPDELRLDRVLPRERETELFAALRPVLSAAMEKERFTFATALADALGRRARGFPELQEALREALFRCTERAALGIGVLWFGQADDRVGLAADLLADDTWAVTLPNVWQAVAGHRTDLLEEALAEAGESPWVPPVAKGTAGRWTPCQQDLVRQLLVTAAEDETRTVEVRSAALASLGNLPGGTEALAPWAGRPETFLAEAALDALTHGDDPDMAFPLLVEAARGNASRVAVAALAGCAASLRPSRLGPALHAVLTAPESKVTTRKQAARLLERLRPPGAADVLLRVWDDPGLHRDVRVAVALALRAMPEDPRIWGALDEAAGPYAGEVMLRALCQGGPTAFPAWARPRYAALARRLVTAAEGPGVRFRTDKAFGAWVRWYEGGFADVLDAVADPMAAEGERELGLLQTLVRSGVVGEEIGDVFARLLAAGPDVRAHRRVTRLVGALSGLRPTLPGRDAVRRRVAALLAAEPLYLDKAADLTVDLFDRYDEEDPDPAELADEVERLAVLLRDHPVLAARLEGRPLVRHRRRGHGRFGHEQVRPAVRRLAHRGDLTSHLMAVAAVGVHGEAAGWTPAWRDLLAALRGSPHVEVRQAAWRIEEET